MTSLEEPSDPAKGLASTARTDPSFDDPSVGKEGKAARDIRHFTLLQTLPQIYCSGKNNVGAPRCVKLNMSYCVGGNFDKHPGAHRHLNRQGAGIPSNLRVLGRAGHLFPEFRSKIIAGGFSIEKGAD